MWHRRHVEKVKQSTANDAKRDVLEELFNDVYHHRRRIYKVNFIRGVFFGFGSVLGGTILLALIVTILSFFASLFHGAIGDFINQIISSVEQSRGR